MIKIKCPKVQIKFYAGPIIDNDAKLIKSSNLWKRKGKYCEWLLPCLGHFMSSLAVGHCTFTAQKTDMPKYSLANFRSIRNALNLKGSRPFFMRITGQQFDSETCWLLLDQCYIFFRKTTFWKMCFLIRSHNRPPPSSHLLPPYWFTL